MNLEKTKQFGVFYTCYTELEAVEYSILAFRYVYPDIPIYLVSDGGADYKDLEDKFSHIVTSLENDSRSHIPNLTAETFCTNENQIEIKKSIMTLFERIKSAIEYCGNPEWMMIMEPDVLVRGELNFPEHAHLLGSRVNSGLSNELREVLSSIPGAIDVNNWGVTPAIFRTKTFMDMCNWIEETPQSFAKLCEADYRLSYYDVTFAVLFGAIGYPEIFNPDIVECFRNPNWQSSWHPLVHQFRGKYPKSGDGYQGTHVKHKDGIGDYWPWEVKDD